jgi:hypothetical protein
MWLAILVFAFSLTVAGAARWQMATIKLSRLLAINWHQRTSGNPDHHDRTILHDQRKEIPKTRGAKIAKFPRERLRVCCNMVLAAEPLLQTKMLLGRIRLPRWGYLNNSMISTATITLAWSTGSEEKTSAEAEAKRDRRNAPIYFESQLPKVIPSPHNGFAPIVLIDGVKSAKKSDELFIEGEFITGGITVAGPKVQRFMVSSGDLKWNWALSFDKSGRHEVVVVFRAILINEGREKAYELYRTPQQHVRVVVVPGLTQREIIIVSAISGTLSAGWIVVQALNKFGIL